MHDAYNVKMTWIICLNPIIAENRTEFLLQELC
jgi:hypothetical protein